MAAQLGAEGGTPAEPADQKVQEEAGGKPIADESNSGSDCDDAGVAEEEGVEPESKKARKRKARAEKHRSDWKAAQKAKRQKRRQGGEGGGGRGGGWRWRKFGVEGGAEGEDCPSKAGGDVEAAGQQQEAVAAPGAGAAADATPVDKEAAKQARAAKKAAELADFKARCAAGTTVVIDCEWEDYMTDKEQKSFVQQLMYCYSTNRAAEKPVRLVYTGVTADSVTSTKLRKMSGFDTWPLEVLEDTYIESFPKEKLVYLTADAEQVLQAFDPEKVYIIGGIVDHNRLKGHTLAKAEEQGIAVAQLPLAEHIEMGTSSRVLAVNHVLQIVAEHQATGNWRKVLDKCIPGRKKWLDAAADGGDCRTEANGGEAAVADGSTGATTASSASGMQSACPGALEGGGPEAAAAAAEGATAEET